MLGEFHSAKCAVINFLPLTGGFPQHIELNVAHFHTGVACLVFACCEDFQPRHHGVPGISIFEIGVYQGFLVVARCLIAMRVGTHYEGSWPVEAFPHLTVVGEDFVVFLGHIRNDSVQRVDVFRGKRRGHSCSKGGRNHPCHHMFS